MMYRTFQAAIAAVAALIVSACATAPPPPTTSLADRTCVASPNLGSATVLALPTESVVSVTLDGTAPCLANGEARSVYTVFRLPDSDTEYLLSLTSAPLGQGLFSPNVRVLNADGSVAREVPRDSFVFRGSSLSLGLRMRPEEEYLLVQSDTDTTGQNISQIQDGTMMYSAYPVMMYGGTSTTATYVYSYNGTISVSTRSVPE